MIACPNCAHPNREGLLFCEICGDSLVQVAMAVAQTRRLEMASVEPVIKEALGTAQFASDTTIVLQVSGHAEPVVLTPAPRNTLGRVDPSNSVQPDLDLTSLGGLDRGVSRIHAEITRSEGTLNILDRGSANGTFLNGERLVPDEPRLIRDGDEIRLGRLVAHIYFR